ncbi:uncharacterized protein PHALS_14528 [Plasmopara halstedii]|uniref:Uncharacterized protein n=1 Tax=Plasmopara halstedii TaxID=4781 RepID=A0A0P1ATM9_PLAHL|nr:uncharacterized protein PHALS_14528 [Plasmopara halstedii]CEG44860.1 hypothetical protein PHALS_14528 [Plasmopara halstedii]|eukprot:XP_024581229.1 hypothetical protein PHALS_14528 [Plasmopara halstedii]
MLNEVIDHDTPVNNHERKDEMVTACCIATFPYLPAGAVAARYLAYTTKHHKLIKYNSHSRFKN